MPSESQGSLGTRCDWSLSFHRLFCFLRLYPSRAQKYSRMVCNDRNILYLLCPIWEEPATCGCWASEIWLLNLRNGNIDFTFNGFKFKWLDMACGSCAGQCSFRGWAIPEGIHSILKWSWERWVQEFPEWSLPPSALEHEWEQVGGPNTRENLAHLTWPQDLSLPDHSLHWRVWYVSARPECS